MKGMENMAHLKLAQNQAPGGLTIGWTVVWLNKNVLTANPIRTIAMPGCPSNPYSFFAQPSIVAAYNDDEN